MDLSIFSFRAPKQNYRKPIKYFGTPFVLADMLVRRVSISSDQIRIRDSIHCSIVDETRDCADKGEAEGVTSPAQPRLDWGRWVEAGAGCVLMGDGDG